MKAKVLAALAATMAVSATCAFAANPFVDVPTDSWAYKSVVELADAGVIQGVDGEYFQGQRNITRYEAAEMVAKAMAHMDKASVEQRALINKLADEYADELNNLGVRVSNLENKVGNVKFTGDGRLRYRYQSGNKDNDNSWDYRIRLRGTAQINDRTTATLGMTTNNQSFGENGSAQEDQIAADIIKVDYNFGGKNWLLSLGREADWKLGGPRSYAYQYGDTFDRAELKYQNDRFAVTAGYGKFKEDGGNYSIVDATWGEHEHDWEGTKGRFQGNDAFDGLKMGYGEIEAFFGNGSAAGVYYGQFNRTGDGIADGWAEKFYDADNLWGVYANVNIGSKWNVLANYESIDRDGYSATTGNPVSDPEVWIGKLTYGKAVMAQPKSWDIWVEYIDAEDGAWLGGSTGSWRNFGSLDNMTSWGVGIDYIVAKNLKFSVMQSFATDIKDAPDVEGQSDNELTRAEFTFAF